MFLYYCRSWVCAFALSLLCAHSTTAGLLNHTVDDANSTIIYSPADSWSQGDGCSDCNIKLNPESTFDGTWHDTTYIPGNSPATITFRFEGVAVYVFNVLANNVSVPNTTTTTSLNFFVDGNAQESFLHIPDDTTDILYNVPVLSVEGLEYGTHTLVIEATDSPKSVILFDYLIYTTFLPDPNTSSSTTTTTIVPSTTSSTSTSTSSTTTSSSTTSTLPSSTTSSSAIASNTTSSTLASSATSSVPSTTLISPSSMGSSSSAPTHSAGANIAGGSSSTHSNTGIIVGSVAGGLGGLLLLSILLLLRHRYQAHDPRPYAEKRERPRSFNDPRADPRAASLSSATQLILIGDGNGHGSNDTTPAPSTARESSQTLTTVSYFDNDAASSAIPLCTPSTRTRPLSDASSLYRAAPSSFFLGPDALPPPVPPVPPLPPSSDAAPVRRNSDGWWVQARALPPVPGASAAEVGTNRDTAGAEGSMAPGALLHAKVMLLEEEVARLKAQQQEMGMGGLFQWEAAPPEYGQQ